MSEVPPEIAQILDSMVSQAKQAHDRQHMKADAAKQELYRFFDSLTLEQCMTMRLILNLFTGKKMSNYLDGHVAATMRHKFGVDPDTGKTPMEEAQTKD